MRDWWVMSQGWGRPILSPENRPQMPGTGSWRWRAWLVGEQPPAPTEVLRWWKNHLLPIFSLLKMVTLPSGTKTHPLGTWLFLLVSLEAIMWRELDIAGVVWSVAGGTGQTSATLSASSSCPFLIPFTSISLPPHPLPPLPASFLPGAETTAGLRAHLRNFHPLAVCVVTLLYNIKKHRLISEVTWGRENGEDWAIY